VTHGSRYSSVPPVFNVRSVSEGRELHTSCSIKHLDTALCELACVWRVHWVGFVRRGSPFALAGVTSYLAMYVILIATYNTDAEVM